MTRRGQSGKQVSRSGKQVSFWKGVAAVADDLARRGVADAEQVAAAILAPALSEKQRGALGVEALTIVSKGARRTVAARIAAAHNQLRQAVLAGGVLAFSPEGRAVQPLPEDDQYGLGIDRLPFPIHDHDVSVDDVDYWLAEHRAWQEEAYAERERERAEAHARGEIRRGEQGRNYGMATGAANCTSCGALKSRPSAICTLCGDEPSGNPDAYDRAHGYAADAARAA